MLCRTCYGKLGVPFASVPKVYARLYEVYCEHFETVSAAAVEALRNRKAPFEDVPVDREVIGIPVSRPSISEDVTDPPPIAQRQSQLQVAKQAVVAAPVVTLFPKDQCLCHMPFAHAVQLMNLQQPIPVQQHSLYNSQSPCTFHNFQAQPQCCNGYCTSGYQNHQKAVFAPTLMSLFRSSYF